MKISSTVLLAFLVLATVCGSVFGHGGNDYGSQTDHTWVSNWSSRAVRGTTSYSGGDSQFISRLIQPGAKDSDEYHHLWGNHAQVTLEMWIDRSSNHQTFEVDSDQSVVCYDNPSGGVDVYFSRPGTLVQKDGPNPVITLT